MASATRQYLPTYLYRSYRLDYKLINRLTPYCSYKDGTKFSSSTQLRGPNHEQVIIMGLIFCRSFFSSFFSYPRSSRSMVPSWSGVNFWWDFRMTHKVGAKPLMIRAFLAYQIPGWIWLRWFFDENVRSTYCTRQSSGGTRQPISSWMIQSMNTVNFVDRPTVWVFGRLLLSGFRVLRVSLRELIIDPSLKNEAGTY